jgi:hypothetical protein
LLLAADLVRNHPFPRNRPKVLDLSSLNDANIARLCARCQIVLFDYGQASVLGIAPNNYATASDDKARAIVCRTVRRACATQPVVGAARCMTPNFALRRAAPKIHAPQITHPFNDMPRQPLIGDAFGE